MFKKRLVSTCVLVAGLILVVGFSPMPLCGWIVPVLLTLLAALALAEFEMLTTDSGVPSFWKPFSLMALVYYLGIYQNRGNPSVFTAGWDTTALWAVLVLAFGWAAWLWIRHGDRYVPGRIIATMTLSWIYIVWSLGCLMKILYFEGLDGRLLIFFFFLCVKGSDIAAYVSGNFFGRHRLAPSLSPGKTVEGAVGGLLAVMLLAAIPGLLPGVSLGARVLTGGLLGIFSQVGDLAESLLKRQACVKDSARFLPGLGGALDLLDSLLLTAPLFVMLLHGLY